MLQKSKTKRDTVEKSYLEVSNRSKNLFSVQNRFEIPWDNNHLPNQLLLSSEIALFEVRPPKFDGNSQKSKGFPLVQQRDFIWILLDFIRISSIFDGLNFKWTYLGAQKELVGQTVVVP